MRMLFLALGLAQIVLAGLLLRRSLREHRWFRWTLTAVLLVSGLVWLWFGARGWIVPEAATTGRPVTESPIEEQLVDQGTLLGRVQGGELRVLAPAGSAGGTARLTQIGMAESVSPQSREIDLVSYEGRVIVVRGHDGGGWIYEAEIVESGGPLLTSLVEWVYLR